MGYFYALCRRLIFFLQPKILSKIPPVSNSLDSDQAQHYVRRDLDPNCLQMLSTDDTSRQIVKVGVVF